MGSSADKLLSFVNAYIEFVAGEQPTADKFNALVAQTKYGFNGLERAVGDIWTTTYAFGEDNAHLSTQWGPNYTTGGYVSGSDDVGRALDIVNIGRAIGPMSNLNPLILSPEGGMGIEGENVQNAVHEFTLRYIPLPDPSGSGTLEASDFTFSASDGSSLTEFSTWATTPEGVSTAGTYHVTTYGCVYTYDETPAGAVVSYSTDPNYWAGGPNPPNARFNVIPDPNQFGNASEYLAITFEDTTGNYYVTLPTVREQQNNHTNDTASLSGIDANFNLPILLPEVITENFEPGQAIPEGFIYIRNVTRGETFIDATYSYNDENTLVISDVDLHGDDSSILDDEQWVLFTVGTDITSNLNDVQQKVYKHSHSRAFGEPQVHVSDLAGIYEAQKDSTSYYGPSDMEGNWFSQYLHRDGYQTDGNHSNNNNAMRGDLVLGITQDAGGTSDSSGGKNYLNSTGESYVLSFGNSKADDGLQSPRIWRTENENLVIRGQQTDPHELTLPPTGHANAGEDETAQSITLDSRGDLILTTEYSDVGGGIVMNAGGIRIKADADLVPESYTGNWAEGFFNISADGNGYVWTGGTFQSYASRDNLTSAFQDVYVRGQTETTVCSGGNVFIASNGHDFESISTRHKNSGGAVFWVNHPGGGALSINTDHHASDRGISGLDEKYFTPKDIMYGDYDDRTFYFTSPWHVKDSGSDRRGESFAFVGGNIAGDAREVVTPNGDDYITTAHGIQSALVGMYGSNESYQHAILHVHNESPAGGSYPGTAMAISQGRNVGNLDPETRYIVFLGKNRSNGVIQSGWKDGVGGRREDIVLHGSGSGWSNSAINSIARSGDVQYCSGNSDYAEAIVCGDPNEWKEYFTDEGWEKLQNKIKEEDSIINIPEGIVVYVRENAFYRKGPGLPLITTNRACMVGNMGALLNDQTNTAYKELSFTGLVPVFISNSANTGDYILPLEGESVCKAVHPSEVNFEQYRNVIGTAIESIQNEEDNTVTQVMVSIGKK